MALWTGLPRFRGDSSERTALLARAPWSAGLGLLVVTSLLAGVGWLNEVLAVNGLKQARAHLASMFSEGE